MPSNDQTHPPLEDLAAAVSAAMAISPVSEAPAGPNSAEPIPSACPAFRVLLAEDDVVNQKVVCWLLEKRGHRVTVVGNGSEAVRAAAEDHFDVVLMDVQMPELDGLSATGRIRRAEAPEGRHTPIIAITADAGPRDGEVCLQAGMDAHVAKPIRAAELLSAMHELTKPGRGPAVSDRPPADQDPNSRRIGTFNKAAALDRMQGDEELLRETAELFLKNCPSAMTAIHEALGGGDAEALHRSAHTLKSSVGNFGPGAAFDAALTLERRTREGDLRAAREAWPRVHLEMQKLQDALGRIVRGGAACES